MMKCLERCQQLSTLTLAVSAALTALGLAMTLAAPARADAIINSNSNRYATSNGVNVTILSGVTIGSLGSPYAYALENGSNIIVGTISNAGYIDGAITYGILISGGGSIGVLNNSGTIFGHSEGLDNGGTITTLQNTGTISSNTTALFNSSVINTLYNGGTISGAHGIVNSGTIGTIINTGTISGGISNSSGAITTLTNGQNGLTYSGVLPTNYNSYFASGSYNTSTTFATTVFSSTGSSSITNYGILLAASGVTLSVGTYSSVLQSSALFTVQNAGQTLHYTQNGYSVTYELVANGNNYDLDIISFGGSGGGGNNNGGNSGITQAVLAQHNSPAYYAARVIDGSSILSNLFSGASGTAAQSTAASQSLPLVTGGATSVAQTALTSVNTIIDARQSANRGASSGDDFQTNRNMWLKAFGTEADQSDLDGVSGFKAHTGGVTFGADEKVTDKLTLGAAFAYANSNVSSTVGGTSQGINIKGYQLIGYGSLALNQRDSVDFQLDGGMSNNSGSRNISFLNEVASSSYDSWSAHLGSSLNRSYVLSEKLTLTPSLRVDYTRINESGYQESGAGALDLDVNSQHAQALVLGVDGKLDYKLSDTLAVAANLGVGYDTMNKQDAIVAAYAGASTASFVTEGLNQGALISRAGAVLSYKLPKGMEVSAHYDVEGRCNYLSQTASVKFSMPF